MTKSIQIARLEAQIDRDMDSYQKRPRRKFLGARTQEYRFARYIEDWRVKVERVGTLNYPQAARPENSRQPAVDGVDQRRRHGRKRRDQPLIGAEDTRRGGAAHRASRRAASAFPANISRDTDVLSITRT